VTCTGWASASSGCPDRGIVALPAQLVAALKAVPDLRLWLRAPLAPFTTIGVGGPVAVLASAGTAAAASQALALLTAAEAAFAGLGAGSNLLVADRGYEGVALRLDAGLQYVEGPTVGAAGSTEVVAGAGLPLPRLATFVAEAGLSGLEFACGIPGTVGGGVAMNAGAFGGWIGQAVDAVELAGPTGVSWVPASKLEWRYRRCGLPPATMVTAVRLKLLPSTREAVVERHRELLRARRLSQPRGVRTFGSTFRNPPDDSAGRLLDQAGMKGVYRGGAEVSSIHANFIVNQGDATTADVLVLMAMMRQAVEQRFGVTLEPEVRLLGAVFPWER
jgi:UDP-N-acetylenolpyruvoylglucosamine reductase